MSDKHRQKETESFAIGATVLSISVLLVLAIVALLS